MQFQFKKILNECGPVLINTDEHAVVLVGHPLPGGMGIAYEGHFHMPAGIVAMTLRQLADDLDRKDKAALN